MQTFLPYPDFEQSAKCLDWRRLGKQRSECLIILRAIKGEYVNGAWANRPITCMWASYANSLVIYGVTICNEWTQRGYVDNTQPKIASYYDPTLTKDYPSWLGNDYFHDSHKSNLLRKDPVYYGQFNWQIITTLDYYYPL